MKDIIIDSASVIVPLTIFASDVAVAHRMPSPVLWYVSSIVWGIIAVLSLARILERYGLK